jgi:prevent-host-death family protein
MELAYCRELRSAHAAEMMLLELLHPMRPMTNYMVTSINVDPIDLADAEAHLSELVDRVEAGDSIDITRRGRPVARLTAVTSPRQRIPGPDIGALGCEVGAASILRRGRGRLNRRTIDCYRHNPSRRRHADLSLGTPPSLPLDHFYP